MLVLVVAVVGIAVFRFSHAFGGGKIYIYGGNDGPYVSYDFNIDGSVNLKESIAGKERKNVAFAQAQAVGLQMVQDALRASGQAEQADAINPGSLPAEVQTQLNSANQQGKDAQNQSASQQTPAFQPPPSAVQPSSAPAAPSATAPAPTSPAPAKTYPVSGVVDFRLPADIAKTATQVIYRVDGKQIGISKAAPFNQTFNSTRYENGSHLLQAEVKNGFGANKNYVYALQVQNPTDWWSKLVQNFSNVFGQ